MGKRRADNLRSPQEAKQDRHKHYDSYIRNSGKHPSRINPIFTEKPHYDLEVKK